MDALTPYEELRAKIKRLYPENIVKITRIQGVWVVGRYSVVRERWGSRRLRVRTVRRLEQVYAPI
jgi:hypothetical protein